MIKNKHKQFGFDPRKVKILPEHYKFGSDLPLEVLRPDGQWDSWLPIYEPQAEKYETWGCVDWGGQNQIETMLCFLFGIEPNYSERFNYILAGIEEGGSDPQVVYECFRHDGLIDQHFLPIPDTYAEFMTPKPMENKYIMEGIKWLEQYDFYHEWVQPNNPNKMKELIKETLRYSPVALSVTAWYEENGLYVDKGLPNCHWCVCYGYIEDERGLILKIFDSYDQSKKLLSPDHFVSFAKRIQIKKKIKDNTVVKDNWLIEVLKNIWLFIKDIWNKIIKVIKDFYQTNKDLMPKISHIIKLT